MQKEETKEIKYYVDNLQEMFDLADEIFKDRAVNIDEITIYKKIKRSSYRDMHKWADTDIEHVGFQFEAVTVPRNLSPVIV